MTIEQHQRYLTDAEYHARVYVAARRLADWDFRLSADMERDFYTEQAMDLVDVLDSIGTDTKANK